MGKTIFKVILLIIFQRKIPKSLLFYEVMIRRAQQPNQYMYDYQTTKLGYEGECLVDREWLDAGIEGLFFHDFTCFNPSGRPHQIDTIYVCEHFILVVEVKNIASDMAINSQTRQLILNREKALPNPIDQVKRHHRLLQKHFKTLSYQVPIEAAIVMANPSYIINESSNEIPIFAVTGLSAKIEELTQQYQHINLNIRFIQQSLEKLYRPHTKQPWRKMSPIVHGVLCLHCNGKMKPTKNGFKCLRCHLLDSSGGAIRRTLHDDRILYGSEISNKRFRWFTEIESPDTAYGILKRHLPSKLIAGRGSKYYIPDNIYEIKFH